MDSRERITRILSGQCPDQIPLFDTYWTTTIERWHREGMPRDISPQAYFGTDEIARIGGDYTMQFPERVLTQNAEEKTYWDSDGALRIDKHVEEGWTSQWLDFTIKNTKDHAFTKPLLNSTIMPAVGEALSVIPDMHVFTQHGCE